MPITITIKRNGARPPTVEPENVSVVEQVVDTSASQRNLLEEGVYFQATPKQKTFIDAVMSGQYRYLLYGGAIRGGKTYVGLAILVLLSKVFPGSRWIVVRAHLPEIRRNVLPTFFKLCPPNFLESFNQSTITAHFKNGSEILFFSEQYSDDPELLRWRGLEFNGALLEEANELQEATWYKCIERLGSWLINPMPPMLIILTCNPGQGWLKEKFYDKWMVDNLKAPYYYLQAKISDNPYIPQEFLDKLKDMPEALYRKFVEGSWDAEDDIDQLIPWADIHRAVNPLPEQDERPMYLGVDVGRFGPDKTVFTLLKGGNIHSIKAFSKTTIDEVVDYTKKLIVEYGIKPTHVGVDVVGLGAGVVDFLHKDRLYVEGLSGGSAPIELSVESSMRLFSFANFRAQMYWQLKKDFAKGALGKLDLSVLKDDLAAIHYGVKGDKKIFIEGKDDIKERIGRSPDYSDSLMYANWMRVKYNTVIKPGFAFG